MKIGKLPHNNSRQLVIGDIHGCNKTFRFLVEQKIKLTTKDQLFLLGDYIDRGPDSKGVIDYILELKNKNFHVYPLMGNHEDTLLEFTKDEFRFLNWHIVKNNLDDLMNEKQLAKKYHDFLISLPLFYQLNDFLLVHAGINFNSQTPLQDKDNLLWLRKTIPDTKFLNGRKIIVGHQPTPLSEIKKQIENNSTVINLDNGACYTKRHKIYDSESLGNLCCLNLNNMKLTVQPNIEKP